MFRLSNVQDTASFFRRNIAQGVDFKAALEYSGHAGLEVVLGRAASGPVAVADYIIDGSISVNKKCAVGLALSGVDDDRDDLIAWEVAARVFGDNSIGVNAVFGEMASNAAIGVNPANPSPMTNFRALASDKTDLAGNSGHAPATIFDRGTLIYRRESAGHMPVLACEVFNHGGGSTSPSGQIWLSMWVFKGSLKVYWPGV